MKHIVYFLTGYAFYTLLGLPLSLALEHFCPPDPGKPVCMTIWMIVIAICLVCMPWACKRFYHTGKWFWTEFVPDMCGVAQ